MMKTKDFTFTITKAVDDSGTFEGYASTFNNVDSYGEKVMPGAFVESLNRHKREGSMPLLLWQHNPDEPLGGWEDLAEDGKGLWGRGRIMVDAGPTEKRVHMHMRAGNIRGLSIGYREVEVEPDSNIRLLKKLDLMEVSIVSFPANRRARIDAVKDERMSDFARRLRDGDPPSIKEFEDILREAGVPKAMAVQIASVGYAKAIRSESEGGKATTAIEQLRAATRAFLPS